MTDVTKHDLDKHQRPPAPKSLVWYKFWPINKNQAKCPTCGVNAEFKDEKEK